MDRRSLLRRTSYSAHSAISAPAPPKLWPRVWKRRAGKTISIEPGKHLENLNEKLIKFTLPSPDQISLSVAAPKISVEVPSKTRVLVAEDDPISRVLVVTWLQKWGYDVIATHDGGEAMNVLRRPDAPALAILDWCMPQMDGLEVCRRLRESKKTVYLILLTARGQKEDMIEGLRAGADDYLVKPFHAEELHARLLAGVRVMTVQENLVARVRKLEAAASSLELLRLQIPL